MQKPLRSLDSAPHDLRFTHFGVLDVGGQNKASLATAVVINGLLLAIAVVISAAAVKVAHDNKLKELTYAVIPPVKPPEPPKPKFIPPRPLPKPPVVPPVEPKILLPKITPPVLPKPVTVTTPQPPKPAVTPAMPKVVVAAAAPKVVDVHLGASAAVPNHDAHPSAVSLGQTNSPIAPSNRPATASVNLGQQGMAGMPPGNGRGANATAVSLGSGQPNGSLGGSGVRGVQGVKLGVTGGTGTTPGNGVGTRPPTQVALGHAPTPPPATNTSLARIPAKTGPQVIFKPKPQYTADATANKIEGLVSVRIRVSASGDVTVLGVTNGLGHGLDESAVRAVQATKFHPAVDANGSPTNWEGVVNISFQMAS